MKVAYVIVKQRVYDSEVLEYTETEVIAVAKAKQTANTALAMLQTAFPLQGYMVLEVPYLPVRGAKE